jgi:hypothetical protein
MIDAKAVGTPASLPFVYRAFGVGVQSAFELPELQPDGSAAPELRILTGTTSRRTPADLNDVLFERAEDGSAYFCWPGIGSFAVERDGRIIVDRWGGAEERTTRLPLLGIVLAYALHLRGTFTLHASSVAIDDAAYIFLGDKGAGKSTTCAAAVAAGARLLTDDVVAVRAVAGEAPLVMPGFPQIKIERQVAERLFGQDVTLERLFEGYVKLSYRPPGSFDLTPVRVAAAFVLRRGAPGLARRLPPHEVFGAMMRYSYVVRFPGALGKSGEIEHFRTCASLAKEIEAFELGVPGEIDRIPEALEAAVAAVAAGRRR